MSKLLARRVINCPYNLAREYLADKIAPKVATGLPTPLALTVSTPPIGLSKSVSVTFASAIDPMHFDQPWHIHWNPASSAYPVFDGELAIRADETYSTAILEITGAYDPPGGTLGQAFAWIAGGRIATATANALLEKLGADFEARYRHDEDLKRRQRSA